MNRIKVLDKEFEISIPSEKIQERILEMANQISADLKSLDPVFIAILNGSFMFASDLFKKLSIDAQITFLKLASYQGTTTSGTVKQLIGLNQEIKNQNIVILEDIVDTGITLDTIMRQLSGYQPASIRVATLLYKPDACKTDIPLDYIGFPIPNEFIIGYGLDYNGYGRKYKDIYTLVTNH
ncbi:MAG: hypoxanthine phosphoribosyltransferase [Bacteroidales bacterium]|nr:hypoxanthine phosphoribosyltransferase [Bacteroidales bacterium]MCB9013346.1 hypoxanthine phosphoribosyltransferase [Bacteroidales bacterium]